MGSSHSSHRTDGQERRNRRGGLRRSASEVLRRARLSTVRESRRSLMSDARFNSSAFYESSEINLDEPPHLDDSGSGFMNRESSSESFAGDNAEDEEEAVQEQQQEPKNRRELPRQERDMGNMDSAGSSANAGSTGLSSRRNLRPELPRPERAYQRNARDVMPNDSELSYSSRRTSRSEMRPERAYQRHAMEMMQNDSGRSYSSRRTSRSDRTYRNSSMDMMPNDSELSYSSRRTSRSVDRANRNSSIDFDYSERSVSFDQVGLEAVGENQPLTPTQTHRSITLDAISPMGVPPVMMMADGLTDHSFSNSTSDDPLLFMTSTGSRMPSQNTDYSGGNNGDGDDEELYEFYPPLSRGYEWMGRSIESLLLGHLASAPMLRLLEDDIDIGDDEEWSGYVAFRRRSTASTFGGDFSRHRGSVGSSYAGSRRGSLSLNTGAPMHGGTMANYFNRRRQMHPTDVDRSSDRPGRRGSTHYGPVYRRRSTTSTVSTHFGNIDNMNMNSAAVDNMDHSHGGPNIVLSLMARELTGRTTSRRGTSPLQRLRAMGGTTLYGAIDRPAAGMGTELAFLAAAIDTGDWAETQTIVSRLAPRLIGDPSAVNGPGNDAPNSAIDDPSLPPSASPYYAGGGRLGLERDAFVQASGVRVLMRIFREKSFVGQEMAQTYDARDLGEGLVGTRLAPCWNEALASLRELIFAIPTLVEDGTILDNGEFLPFLFTLLSHDSCFDSAAALIEEILSLMTHSPQAQTGGDGDSGLAASPPLGRVPPVTTFFLGNVPDLYKLWGGFNCRQLAHFCRILALLVFEPEDRQLLESPAVLKSSELLHLRRNRAIRAGRDSTVDMNQAILLGDVELTRRLLKLLRVMNFAPTTRRSSPYHVMAHFPFIADTLIMLGLNELDSWEEIDRLEQLARTLLTESNKESESSEHNEHEELLVSELGFVADMLENLSTTLLGNTSEPGNQLGHIIHVISAAQQAGVVVDRSRQGSQSRRRTGATDRSHDRWEENSGEDNEETALQGLPAAAGMLTDQVLVRRLYASIGQDIEDNPMNNGMQVVGIGVDRQGGEGSENSEGGGSGRSLIANPQDAANALQFNALLLGPYQVEVLFVLCTLLGGRRKIDAQEQLNKCGVIPVLDDMFQRLPWHISTREQSASDENQDQSNDAGASEDQPDGIHGPGCECTPESALCVQYLRLLHNFCDRDCDNYGGRHNLLSESEKAFVLKGTNADANHQTEQGLLSKIVGAFVRESDESPYRFWLASCIESYLRGSSPGEQVFVARSGLLDHLIEDVTSERLHCAGSLQTSFDLLGELCKGNRDVLLLLVSDLDEESFRKLMSVAAANLVDSNVFIRSLWLSLERMSAAHGQVPLHIDRSMAYDRQMNWGSQSGASSRSYLTHSWWDTVSIGLADEEDSENEKDDTRSSDWFPTIEAIDSTGVSLEQTDALPPLSRMNESVGHFGWVFSPVGDALSAATHEPNTVERLSWFLAANRARLLRDLLGVVDLRNINHENICCLNTAVVIAIFAHRRRELSPLLLELRQMNDEEKETKQRAIAAAAANDDFVDRAFVQAMRLLDINQDTPSYSRRASLRASIANSQMGTRIGDRTDVMRNFREVLWFWFEYYTHRGRDRLSLEFSSHLRFQEWMSVVSHLVSDDGAPTSLVHTPVRLPRSPYQSAARIAESMLRGA